MQPKFNCVSIWNRNTPEIKFYFSSPNNLKDFCNFLVEILPNEYIVNYIPKKN